MFLTVLIVEPDERTLFFFLFQSVLISSMLMHFKKTGLSRILVLDTFKYNEYMFFNLAHFNGIDENDNTKNALLI